MVYWWHLVWLWVGEFSLNWKQKSSIERYPIKLCMNMNEKTEKEKWKKALVDLRRYKIVYRFAFIIIATNKIYSESFDIWPLFDRKHFVCFSIFEKSNRPNTVESVWKSLTGWDTHMCVCERACMSSYTFLKIVNIKWVIKFFDTKRKGTFHRQSHETKKTHKTTYVDPNMSTCMAGHRIFSIYWCCALSIAPSPLSSSLSSLWQCVCVCTYIVCCVGNTLHVQNYLLYISVIVLCQLLIYELPCHKLIWTFWNVPMGPNVPEYWPILDGCFVQEMVLVMVVTVRI